MSGDIDKHYQRGPTGKMKPKRIVLGKGDTIQIDQFDVAQVQDEAQKIHFKLQRFQ